MVQVKVQENGSTVVPYANNPEFGYVVLESTETIFDQGWLKTKERSTLMRGETKALQGHFTVGKTLPGRIKVIECVEDSVPAEVQSQLQKDLPFEEQIAPFLKRAGSETAPILMSGEKRILRFTDYDPTGASVDIRVQHDNTDAIKAFNASQTSDNANLPT
jgi:hypothetical protein